MISSSEEEPMFVSGAIVAPQVHGPAPARPNLREKALHVGHHRLRRLARQHALEVLAREAVLLLVEERPGELEPYAHQAGVVDEHRMKRGDGLVEQRVELRIRFRLTAQHRLHRRQANLEENVHVVRMVRRQRAKDGERLVEAPLRGQRPRLRHPRFGRGSGFVGVRCRGSEREQQEAGRRERAAEAWWRWHRG